MTIDSEEIHTKLPSSSLEYYLAILGSKKSRLPKISEMPDRIFLPPDFTDTLWTALTKTNKTGKEIRVDLNVRNGLIKPSRYIIGTKDHTADYLDNIFAKKFAVIHTHPINSPGFSTKDMAVFYSNPHLGYLDLTISNGGISALARTQETATTPFSSTIKTMKEIGYLASKHAAVANLTERGYVYYDWENTSQTFHQQAEDGTGYNTTNPLDFNQIKSGVELIRKEIK